MLSNICLQSSLLYTTQPGGNQEILPADWVVETCDMEQDMAGIKLKPLHSPVFKKVKPGNNGPGNNFYTIASAYTVIEKFAIIHFNKGLFLHLCIILLPVIVLFIFLFSSKIISLHEN